MAVATQAAGEAPIVTIPVETPEDIEEIEEAMKKHAIAFTERTNVFAMTILLARWGAFLDRKLDQMKKRLEDAKAKATEADNIGDLQRQIDAVATWEFGLDMMEKDISFASTSLGNTMAIHVVAFQTSGATILFKEFTLTRGLEVHKRSRHGDAGAGTKALKGICSLGIWLLVEHAKDEQAEGQEQRMIQKLQKEDVTKYLIAKTYKQSLAMEGIQIKILARAP